MSAEDGEHGALERDPLASALLPVLLHRIHNATQLLGTLHAIVRETGDAAWLERRSEDLAATGRAADELGYVLAVLASACGADLLLERREPRGVEILCDAARESLRREGRNLRLHEGELPELTPAAGCGWELPWGIAAALVAGASAPADVGGPRWRIAREEEGWQLRIAAAPTDELRALAPLVAERIPGCTLRLEERSSRLCIPADWLVARRTDRRPAEPSSR